MQMPFNTIQLGFPSLNGTFIFLLFYLDGCKLARVVEAKFLGIAIDENLAWKKQIDNVNSVQEFKKYRCSK